MPLPDFPSGINTKLRSKPIPFKKPKTSRPPDPRRRFLVLFIVAMIALALYPVLRAWLVMAR